MALQLVTLEGWNLSDQAIRSPVSAGFGAAIDTLTLVLWRCDHAGKSLRLWAMPDDSSYVALQLLCDSNIISLSLPVDVTTSGLFVSYAVPNAIIELPYPQLTCLMLSLDMTGQRVSAYLSDVPLTGDPPAFFHAGTGGNADVFWRAYNPNTGTTGIGSLWADARFTDFSIEANRRKFINANLSPVELGTDGSTPFGTPPIVFLRVPTAGAAADFVANAGTGGAWTIINGPLALDTACVVVAPPDPPLLPGVPDPGPDPHPGGPNPEPGSMMVILLPPAELQFLDANGHPYAGGTVETYIRGTQTPKATWSDPEAAALNTNPITLDSAGRAIIYGDGAYRTILRDADGNLIWDQPSFTYTSQAMAPVVGAPTIAAAVELLGIQDIADAAVAAEAATRAAGDATEAAARIEADTALQAAVEALQAVVEAEVTARIAADAALQAAIEAIPGPTTDPTLVRTGSFTTNADGQFSIAIDPPFPHTMTGLTIRLVADGAAPAYIPFGYVDPGSSMNLHVQTSGVVAGPDGIFGVYAVSLDIDSVPSVVPNTDFFYTAIGA